MVTDYFKEYQEAKKEVLDEHKKYDEFVKKIEEGIYHSGLAKSQKVFAETFKKINKFVKKIEEDRFSIMIAGEAKSGKSTFINAYLGVELLPMDVKQCTSSIVVIKYGKQFKMVATFAGGSKKEFTDEAKIKEFLKNNAALNDKYRDIPVPTINHNLLVKFGKMNKNVPETEIKCFLDDEQVKKANIHHIDDYDEKIRKYINTNKDKWRDIVTKIEIFFPFKDDSLKGIEIIDSPGVCARGGVEDFTANYIENANAIIFLKPISGQALESAPFNEFMKDKSVERNKNALFLVLTRSTNVTPADKERIKDEAYKQFGQLPKENILIVDSKAKIYANQFDNCTDFAEIKEIIEDLKKKQQLDDFVKADIGDSYCDRDEFIRLLKNRANFDAVDNALSKFGHKAHYIILSELLDNILRVYTKYYDFLKENIDYLKTKAEDPRQLAARIEHIQRELAEINNKMYRGINDVTEEYTGENGKIKKTADSEAENYTNEVEKINANSSGSFDELQRQAFLKIDKFKLLQESLQKELISTFNKALVEITNKSDVPYSALEPDFSEDTFKGIIERTKNSANIVQQIEPAGCFKDAKYRSVYSRDRHFEIVKKSIDSRIEEIKGQLVANLEDFVVKIREVYVNKLKENANEKTSELNSVKEAKMNNEQIEKSIKLFGDLMSEIENHKSAIKNIRGGFDAYVQ